MNYTVFGKTGLQVSQIALGTGNFGTGWGHGADARESEAIFNAYAEAGGNFIDTADIYQFGQSEEILGTLLAGRRENFVLTTKFTRGAAADTSKPSGRRHPAHCARKCRYLPHGGFSDGARAETDGHAGVLVRTARRAPSRPRRTAGGIAQQESPDRRWAGGRFASAWQPRQALFAPSRT